jgi:hypothetical protein
MLSKQNKPTSIIKSMFKKLFSIDDKWFFKETCFCLKIFQIYVRGDLIILLPFLILIFLTGFVSLKIMFFLLLVYFILRQFGELIYWFLQQFSKRTHRPYDFGFKKLSNNAIYIIYQLISFCFLIIGVVLFYIFYWK